MSTIAHENKRRVYLACRTIFSGDRAHLRFKKQVRNEVKQKSKALQPLTADLGLKNVVDILRDLLERRIFESQLRAKLEFPDLFTTSAEQDIQREASEADAARSVAEALDEIAIGESKHSGHTNGQNSAEEFCEPEDMDDTITVKQDHIHELAPDKTAPEEPRAEDDGNDDEAYTSQRIPSLYPTYLPYSAQHLILNGVQRLLEESFFCFAQQHHPAILDTKGWDCAAAGELTKWTTMLLKPKVFPREALGKVDTEKLRLLCHSVAKIRHSAVHRLRMPARGLQDLFRAAQELVSGVLGDHERASRIEDIARELASQVEGLEMGKSALINGAVEGLRDIEKRRAELDREEVELVEGTVRWDRENGVLAGHMLESVVGNILEPPKNLDLLQGGAMWEMKTEMGNKEKGKKTVDDDNEIGDLLGPIIKIQDFKEGEDETVWDE